MGNKINTSKEHNAKDKKAEEHHEFAKYKNETERKRAKRERDEELLKHYDKTHDSNL